MGNPPNKKTTIEVEKIIEIPDDEETRNADQSHK